MSTKDSLSSRKMRSGSITLVIMTTGLIPFTRCSADDFNLDFLGIEDKKNIDVSRFSQSGYIQPGTYELLLQVNNQSINPQVSPFSWYDYQGSESHKQKKTLPCLSQAQIKDIGFTSEAIKNISYWHNGTCADINALPGVEIKPDLSNGLLALNIPQHYLEYSSASWLPPSRWEQGLSGLMFDYNINGSLINARQGGSQHTLSYNGTVGQNVASWRLRADYQGSNYSAEQGSRHQFNWNRYYLYRAIPEWRAKLTVGENSINSSLYPSWRYSGISLDSDDRMLPPNLRGYAPQISGLADTNARVKISQYGQVLYDSTVPAGYFSINDLDSAVRGRLDVEIIEQNGEKKTFQVETASVPYLSRPGQLRFKIATGRPRGNQHSLEGPPFASSDLSWGVNNDWSVYGGTILSADYSNLALGIGRNFQQLGTLSLDISQSRARMPAESDISGHSLHLGYAKYFDDTNTDITFSGYRFSDKQYMGMDRYISTRYGKNSNGAEKYSYVLMLNKHFIDSNISTGVQYSYQNYWDGHQYNYLSLNVNRYFDMFSFKNISLGISASRSQYQAKNNDAVYLRLSMPLGSGNASVSSSYQNSRWSQNAGYSDTTNGGLDSYSFNTGASRSGSGQQQRQFNGIYTHQARAATLSGNASLVENGYTTLGMSASGGGTITAKGAALHSGAISGGTRLMVSTEGVEDVQVDGGRSRTNRFGIGVIGDVSSYYRTTTTVDLNSLPDDVEVQNPVVESVLTEGAIGYRQFKVLKGNKIFSIIALNDGSHPPFAASVTDKSGRELGMVTDGGQAWLRGINGGTTLNVNWDDGQHQCQINIPATLNRQQYLLPCSEQHPAKP